MPSFLNGLLYEKKQQVPAAIKHILKPKWLKGVSIRRSEDSFKIEFWQSGTTIVKDREKFKGEYRHRGNFNKHEVNLLGEYKIDYTMLVGSLDVNQCFSIAKPVLLNRIQKSGSTTGELFIKYEEKDEHGFLLYKSGNSVVIHADIKEDEELVVNDMAISLLLGPDAIARRYGEPTVGLSLDKHKEYKKNKSAVIKTITLTWGDETTKYIILFECDVERKEISFDITVN